MKHVFILGAGASRESGGPLMADFLDHAERLRRSPNIDQAAFDLVFKGVDELQVAHSKAILDINNIESVMAAFEMAALFGRLGNMAPADVLELPKAITTLVAQTVEELVEFDLQPSRGVQPGPAYATLANTLKTLLSRKELVSVLTFNYDLGADYAIDSLDRSIDYGLSAKPLEPSAIPLLKLHGSLAWTTLKDSEDKQIVPISVRSVSAQVGESLPGRAPRGANGNVPLRVRGYLNRDNTTGRPVIVPPTWAKGTYYSDIKSVWRRAADEMKEAENIYVMGYSLPSTDEFFRLLFALGTAGTTRLKRFWVFDPNPDVEQKFRSILGQAAEARFKFFPLRFTQGLSDLISQLLRDGVLKPGQ